MHTHWYRDFTFPSRGWEAAARATFKRAALLLGAPGLHSAKTGMKAQIAMARIHLM